MCEFISDASQQADNSESSIENGCRPLPALHESSVALPRHSGTARLASDSSLCPFSDRHDRRHPGFDAGRTHSDANESGAGREVILARQNRSFAPPSSDKDEKYFF